MTDRRPFILSVAAAVIFLAAVPGWAATITIGYVELQGDPRYDPVLGSEDIVLATRHHPFSGAEIALDEAKPLAPIIHQDFALDRVTVKSRDELVPAVNAAITDKGEHFLVLDLPDDAVALLGQALRGRRDVLLFNATATADALRRKLCAPELVHTIPSLAMETDAVAQYLVFHKWREVLVLQGPRLADQVLADAFAHSAAKFGAEVVDRRRFRLGNDPRQRDEDDVALLTATDSDYDTVFVADSDGEFGRGVPYRTTRPRPVVGSVGLIADAWDWTWDRYGAPQLTGRFLARTGRHMTGLDWAAWIAAKMVVQASLLTHGGNFAPMRAVILDDTPFDGVKGLAVGVRPWDHQLRQAILLSTADAVVASAPLPGFLHETNELDTLGDDRPETPCHLDGGGAGR
jgi:ABC transporter substrate binding protein (PQQ-dependent alcohol dehydrogenase system)